MPDPIRRSAPSRHQARLALDAGRQASLSLEIAITSAGLLAIGGLVSMILLSTATIVAVAWRYVSRSIVRYTKVCVISMYAISPNDIGPVSDPVCLPSSLA